MKNEDIQPLIKKLLTQHFQNLLLGGIVISWLYENTGLFANLIYATCATIVLSTATVELFYYKDFHRVALFFINATPEHLRSLYEQKFFLKTRLAEFVLTIAMLTWQWTWIVYLMGVYRAFQLIRFYAVVKGGFRNDSR